MHFQSIDFIKKLYFSLRHHLHINNPEFKPQMKLLSLNYILGLAI